MTATWHVWTDGSCVHGETPGERAATSRGLRGHGGWAAIVEHGHDGVVLRGREVETTNVRMELLAAVEGLAAVPSRTVVVLHTDATAIVSCHLRWTDGRLDAPGRRRVDDDLWQLLGQHFDRLRVRIDLLGRGPRDPIHRRAHGIAGAEARAALQRLPANAAPLDAAASSAARKRRRRAAAARRETLADAFSGLLLAPARPGNGIRRVP